MAELLVNVIADTKGKVEKKQAQTYEEMQVRSAGPARKSFRHLLTLPTQRCP